MKNKKIMLSVKLEKDDLTKWIEQYHLKEEDFNTLLSLTTDLEKKTECQFSYTVRDNAGYGVITLGMGFDNYQESYNKSGKLFEALLLDYIGLEMLNKLYADCNEIITRETGFYVKEYIFPGTEIPMQEVGKICTICGCDFVTYNSSYAMIPKKSVAFKMILSNKEEDNNYPMCSKCKNENCSYRKSEEGVIKKACLSNINYGYRRIFGNWNNSEK